MHSSYSQKAFSTLNKRSGSSLLTILSHRTVVATPGALGLTTTREPVTDEPKKVNVVPMKITEALVLVVFR